MMDAVWYCKVFAFSNVCIYVVLLIIFNENVTISIIVCSYVFSIRLKDHTTGIGKHGSVSS